MKSFFQFMLKMLPFTLGIILTLMALHFLVDCDHDLDLLEENAFWSFVVFAVIGIPLLIFGIKKASD